MRRHYYAVAASSDEIDLPRLPPLGYLQQSKLIRAAQSGDPEAWKRLWIQHARLAFSVVNRHRVPPQHIADAVQEAQLGLARAIQKFEIERLHEFSTYAYHWLRQAVMRFRKQRVPRTRMPDYLFGMYQHFREHVADAPTRSAWFDARDRIMSSDTAMYERLRRIHAIEAAEPLTRDCPKAAPVPDLLAAEALAERLKDVWDCLGQLTPRERQVICERYGLGDQEERTLEQIGERFGVTRERIRQIQLKAEFKLRKLLAARGYGTPPAEGAVAPVMPVARAVLPAVPVAVAQAPHDAITISAFRPPNREPTLFEP